MRIRYQQSFIGQFSKLTKSQKQLAKDAIELFADNPMHESLRNHPLLDKWSKYRSITADDDLRLHFRNLDNDVVLFVAVGNNEQLYK